MLLSSGGVAGLKPTLLELGSGGGNLALHLADRFALTLSDLSPGMLAMSRALNPKAEHVQGDMRSVRLERRFDAVVIHDAIMYMTTPADLRAALHTAAIHCAPSGVVAVLPDYVDETFEPGADHGGHDGKDGRALRYLEWVWDPDPADDTYIADYAFLLRTPDGDTRAVHDRHVEGLFARARWLEWFAEAGLRAECQRDPFGRDVFIARRQE
jgi:SAM-dependent methyltransferase